VKVADFGLSTFAPTPKSVLEVAGTESYMAPEMFTQRGYGKPVDMWAMGVIIFIVLSGLMPYDASLRKFDLAFVSPEFDNISASAKELIIKLLDKNPATRLTVEQALDHPWVKGETATETTVAINRLKEFNARRRFKKAAFAIRSTLRMKGMVMSIKEKAESIVEKRKNSNAVAEQTLKSIQSQLREIESKVVEEYSKIPAQDRGNWNFDNLFSALQQIQDTARFDKLRGVLNYPRTAQEAPVPMDVEPGRSFRGEYARQAIEDLEKLKGELLVNIKHVDEIKNNLNYPK